MPPLFSYVLFIFDLLKMPQFVFILHLSTEIIFIMLQAHQLATNKSNEQLKFLFFRDFSAVCQSLSSISFCPVALFYYSASFFITPF